jgi:hypothetical protein
MNMKKISLVSVSIIVLSLACAASATPLGTIDIVHSGYSAVDTAKVWGGGLSDTSVYAGVYKFNVSGSTGQGNSLRNGILGGFCMELSETAPSHTVQYDVVMPQNAQNPTTFLSSAIGSAKAAYLSELWGRYFDHSWLNGSTFTSTQKAHAESFAAAVWEIVYENLPSSPSKWNVTSDGTSGKLGFRAENIDSVTANNWLHSLNGTGPMADLRAITRCGNQDFLVEMPAVPEPGTIMLLGVSSFFLLLTRRKPA